MAKGFSLADQLINPETIGTLADGFAGVFDHHSFRSDAIAAVRGLALKERLNAIAEALALHLSDDFELAATQLRQAMPPPLDPSLRDDDFGKFIYAPMGIFVEKQAIAKHFSLGLDLLSEITKRFSMEFSLRAFLNADQEKTMECVRRWAKDDNYHLRRLASEGTRPRLPWGQNVGLSPQDTLPILDALHADPCRFVTRSVANHLNDIAKIAPDLVIERLDKWVTGNLQTKQELLWMRKHALRTLIKDGHTGAMAHLGYDPDVAISGPKISILSQVRLGEKVSIDVIFTPMCDAPLIVDYAIEFCKTNGSKSIKVFKLKSLTGKANTSMNLRKSHHFNDTATTFRLYAGPHRIHLQVNGRRIASADFELC